MGPVALGRKEKQQATRPNKDLRGIKPGETAEQRQQAGKDWEATQQQRGGRGLELAAVEAREGVWPKRRWRRDGHASSNLTAHVTRHMGNRDGLGRAEPAASTRNSFWEGRGLGVGR